jgi:hypothetical protein
VQFWIGLVVFAEILTGAAKFTCPQHGAEQVSGGAAASAKSEPAAV